jgi:hypothetical protein
MSVQNPVSNNIFNLILGALISFNLFAEQSHRQREISHLESEGYFNSRSCLGKDPSQRNSGLTGTFNQMSLDQFNSYQNFMLNLGVTDIANEAPYTTQGNFLSLVQNLDDSLQSVLEVVGEANLPELMETPSNVNFSPASLQQYSSNYYRTPRGQREGPSPLLRGGLSMDDGAIYVSNYLSEGAGGVFSGKDLVSDVGAIRTDAGHLLEARNVWGAKILNNDFYLIPNSAFLNQSMDVTIVDSNWGIKTNYQANSLGSTGVYMSAIVKKDRAFRRAMEGTLLDATFAAVMPVKGYLVGKSLFTGLSGFAEKINWSEVRSSAINAIDLEALIFPPSINISNEAAASSDIASENPLRLVDQERLFLTMEALVSSELGTASTSADSVVSYFNDVNSKVNDLHRYIGGVFTEQNPSSYSGGSGQNYADLVKGMINIGMGSDSAGSHGKTGSFAEMTQVMANNLKSMIRNVDQQCFAQSVDIYRRLLPSNAAEMGVEENYQLLLGELFVVNEECLKKKTLVRSFASLVATKMAHELSNACDRIWGDESKPESGLVASVNSYLMNNPEKGNIKLAMQELQRSVVSDSEEERSTASDSGRILAQHLDD